MMYTLPPQIFWVLSISHKPESTRQSALQRRVRGHEQLGTEQRLGLQDGSGGGCMCVWGGGGMGEGG